MARQGLNREKIVAEAMALIESEGYEKYSLHRLAIRLGVKTASLYNHIESAEQIGADIGGLAITRLRALMDEAAADQDDADAMLLQIAVAYRTFALENPELYKVILNLPALHGKRLILPALDPMLAALRPFAASEQDALSQLRAYRSMIHGFVSLETAGYFEHAGLPIDKSYRQMIGSFIAGLRVQNTPSKE